MRERTDIYYTQYQHHKGIFITLHLQRQAITSPIKTARHSTPPCSNDALSFSMLSLGHVVENFFIYHNSKLCTSPKERKPR